MVTLVRPLLPQYLLAFWKFVSSINSNPEQKQGDKDSKNTLGYLLPLLSSFVNDTLFANETKNIAIDLLSEWCFAVDSFFKQSNIFVSSSMDFSKLQQSFLRMLVFSCTDRLFAQNSYEDWKSKMLMHIVKLQHCLFDNPLEGQTREFVSNSNRIQLINSALSWKFTSLRRKHEQTNQIKTN